MKVVLDTNIFISAFLWQKQVFKVLQFIKRRGVKICVSSEILKEYKRVLSYSHIQKQLHKIDKTPSQIIFELLEISEYYPKTPKINIILDDPSDNIFLACALSAQADFIISGDKHLLKLKSFQEIPILSPSQFLRQFKKSK